MSSMEEKYLVFADIEPDLVAIAKKFRVDDPHGFAKSWFLRMHEILEKWDNGDYPRKYFVIEGTKRVEHLLPDDLSDVDPKLVKLFQDSQKNYLKKAFRRDALKEVKINVKEVHLEQADGASRAGIGKGNTIFSMSIGSVPDSQPPEAYSLFPELIISDLIDVVQNDVDRQKSLISSGREKANFIFLQCMLKFYENLKLEEGNVCIVQNIDSDDVNDFFDKIVRKNQATEIAKYLKAFFQEEPHYGVKLRLKGMLHSKKNNAIHQRISRYLNDMYGGMPSRLRKRLKGRRNHAKGADSNA